MSNCFIFSYVFADDPMLNFKALGCLRCIMRGQDDLPTELVNRSDFIAVRIYVQIGNVRGRDQGSS